MGRSLSAASILGLLTACCLISTATAQRRPQGRRGATIAIRAGTVHPITGDAISNGIVVIRGGRITAVGSADSVKIPDGVEVTEYPEAHIYPGLVDALGSAYADPTALGGSVDASSKVGEGLDPYDRTSRELVTHGITTAYTANRSGAKWRGRGARLHPAATGFVAPRVGIDGSLHLRVSAGGATTHPLAREKALRALGKEFEALEKYEKARDEAEKKQSEYEKKFDEYISWHRKKNGKDKAKSKKPEGADGKKKDAKAKPADKSAGDEGASKKGTPGGRGRRRRGDGGGGQDKAPGFAALDSLPQHSLAQHSLAQGKDEKQGSDKDKKPAPAKKPAEAKKPSAKPADKAPTRPKRPKPWKNNPVQDVLIEVRDGDLGLRIEAREADEVRAALRMVAKNEFADVALEQCFHASNLGAEIARAGIPVILAGPAPERCADAAAKLSNAGVAIAFGSGDQRTARFLPLLAADACMAGMDPDAAVRALTITPAKILGLSKTVGSLERGKQADVIITSGPLLASDSRILRVIARGRTVFEAPR